jgi:hypothetical protein
VRAPRLSSGEAVHVLLVLGFRVVRSDQFQVTMDRAGCLAFVPRQGELSDATQDALMRSVGVGPPELGALLARLQARDTLPDPQERRESTKPPAPAL